MALIDERFENKPSTKTPLNATGLLDDMINAINFLDDKRLKIVTDTTADFNNYTEVGTYYFNAETSFTNGPNAVNGWLQVLTGLNDSVKQIFWRHGTINTNDHMTFLRTRTSQGWSDWQRLMVENDLYYMPGDTFNDIDWWTAGYITASKKRISFDIYLPKRLDNVSVELVSGSAIFRSTLGYAEDGNTVNLKSSNVTTTVFKDKGNRVSIRVEKTTEFTNVYNNTPVAIELKDISLKFK